ncbi:MAG: hypothetical protein ACRDV4_09890 [Acidimicrobiales bacterium]
MAVTPGADAPAVRTVEPPPEETPCDPEDCDADAAVPPEQTARAVSTDSTRASGKGRRRAVLDRRVRADDGRVRVGPLTKPPPRFVDTIGPEPTGPPSLESPLGRIGAHDPGHLPHATADSDNYRNKF